jgi:hypothetical protein
VLSQDYKPTHVPKLYDIDIDFNSIEHKDKIYKAVNCFTAEEIELIKDPKNKDLFNDPCFGN